MPEHRIRLRGAWTWSTPLDPAGPPARVDLPMPWPSLGPGAFRLTRGFGRPPFDPATETIRLELVDVPGLVAARLNGHDLDFDSTPIGMILEARNVLTLDVDPAWAGPWEGPWGLIALVIGSP